MTMLKWWGIVLFVVFAPLPYVFLHAQQPVSGDADVIDSWLVSVDGEPRRRIFRIFGIMQKPGGSIGLEATYGWAEGRQSPVEAEIAPSPEGRRLTLTTPAKSLIVATQTADGSFRGTISGSNYGPKGVTLSRMAAADAPDATPGGNLASPESIGAGTTSSERARLQEIIRRQPPENALKSTIAAFYKEQSDAAIRLGDGQAQLFIARKFAEAAKGAKEEPLAAYRHWRAESEFGDRQRALQLGEERVRDPQNRDARSSIAALLAHDYLQDFHNLKRAEELLAQAEEVHKGVRSIQYRFTGQMQIETTRTLIEKFKGRTREAIAAGESAATMADRVMDDTSFVRGMAGGEIRTSLLRGHLNAHRLLWESLAYAGQIALAEAKATEYHATTVQKEKFSNQPLAEYLTVLGGIKHGARKYAESAAVLARALQVGEAAGMHANTLAMFNASGYLVASLVALGRLDEALLLCDNRIRLKQRYFQTSCALAYHVGGRHDDALRIMRANVKFWSAILPRERHGMVVREGLLGAALVAKGKRTDARQLLEGVVARLPDAKAREPGSQLGISPFVESLIIAAYLDLLAEEHSRASDPVQRRNAAAEAFKVASQMRSSVVQQAVQDAALRAAAGEAGLSDLVRTLQDSQAETKVLYEFLTRQLSAPPERRLPQVVASMRARLAVLEEQEKKIESTIAQKFPAFRELMRPSVPAPQEIAAHLRPGDAFLTVLPTANVTHLWAVSQDAFEYVRLPLKAAELDAAVQRLRRTLELDEGDTLHPFDAATAAGLYRQLVAPVERVLAGKASLLVSASGALAKLPFGVLLTEDSRSSDPAEHQYLIRRFAVNHVVSPAAWLAQMKYDRRTQRASGGFAGFADPVFSAGAAATPAGSARRVRNLVVSRVREAPPTDAPVASATGVSYSSLSPLPETREEVLAIATALKADREHDVFLNLRASRRNVLETRLDDRGVVVFATHGLMAGDLPTLDEPGLALSVTGEKDEDPVLKLSDVLRLRLNADWVVLSACNTAAGDRASDETFSGLGRGFFYAGARSLLLTHWAVETRSATALTTQLFRRFSDDAAITRAEALRQAQLDLIASKAKGGPDHAHPFFWAPFALIGDGGR